MGSPPAIIGLSGKLGAGVFDWGGTLTAIVGLSGLSGGEKFGWGSSPPALRGLSALLQADGSLDGEGAQQAWQGYQGC